MVLVGCLCLLLLLMVNLFCLLKFFLFFVASGLGQSIKLFWLVVLLVFWSFELLSLVLLLVGLLLSSLLLVGFELTLTLSCHCCRALAGGGQDKPVQLQHHYNCSALQCILMSLQCIALLCPATGRRGTGQTSPTRELYCTAISLLH